MNTIRKDVRDLISVNEKLQSALAQGDRLSEDEAVLIRMCASELLENVPAPESDVSYGSNGRAWGNSPSSEQRGSADA
jgi:hypothetical protein